MRFYFKLASRKVYLSIKGMVEYILHLTYSCICSLVLPGYLCGCKMNELIHFINGIYQKFLVSVKLYGTVAYNLFV